MTNYVVNRIFNSITYIVPFGHLQECYLVDCGDVEEIFAQGWQVKGVLLTHVHIDHIYGLNKLLERFPSAVIYTNKYGEDALQNPKLNFSRYHEDVDDFIISKPENVYIIDREGALQLEEKMIVNVLFTPGHDPSCLSYSIGHYMYTGDSYIPGAKVVTTLPRSNKLDAEHSLTKIIKLEESGLMIKPGHMIALD